MACRHRFVREDDDPRCLYCGRGEEPVVLGSDALVKYMNSHRTVHATDALKELARLEALRAEQEAVA